MGLKINFNELPKAPKPLKEGVYLIEIKDVELTETKSGMDAFVFEYDVLNRDGKINDYIMINNADGTPHNFGRKKLRTLIERANIEIMDITPAALKQLSTGKRLKANVKINDNGYPEINYDDFYSKDDEKHDAINLEPLAKEQEATKEVKDAVKDVKPEDFETDDDI